MDHKLTEEAFVAHYNGAPLDDEELASAIVRKLPAKLPVAKAAQNFLEARRMFDAAVEGIGLERG